MCATLARPRGCLMSQRSSSLGARSAASPALSQAKLAPRCPAPHRIAPPHHAARASASSNGTQQSEQALRDEIARLQAELAATRKELAAAQASAQGKVSGVYGAGSPAQLAAAAAERPLAPSTRPAAVGYAFWGGESCDNTGDALVRTSGETIHTLWPQLEDAARAGQPQAVVIHAPAFGAGTSGTAAQEVAYDGIQIRCMVAPTGPVWRLAGARKLFEDLGVAADHGLLRLFLQPDGRILAYPVPCPR